MKPRKMKDSGILWIGQIPEGWAVRKLRFLGSLDSNGVDKKTREDEPLFKAVHYMDVYKNSLGEIGNSEDYLVISAPAEKGAACALLQGDVIFTNSSETPDDIGHSAVVKQDLDNTLFGYHLTRFRPFEKMALRFEKYLFGNQYLKSWFASRATGITRYSITYQDFAEALLPVPSVPEQERIAAYLDGKCGEIDRVIAAKERQNELLKVQRAAIISETVTKGLNPKAKFKDSGIEWAGMVPAKWWIKKIKYMAHMRSGETIPASEIDESGTYPVYGGNGLRGYTDKFTHEGFRLLIGRQGALCGNVRWADGKYWASEHAVVATLLNGCDGWWFYYLLTAMDLNRYSESAAQPGISVDRIINLKIPVPDYPEEQKSIAAYLDTRCGEIDRVMAANEGMVAKLKAYRSSVIWEAVTGKVAV